jgi:hypothetical protein
MSRRYDETATSWSASGQGTFAMAWKDRLTLERHLIATALMIMSDKLEGRPVSEADWKLLALCYRRLGALKEHSHGRQ